EMNLEETINEYYRKGMSERAEYLENLNKKLLPSIVKRIQQNDKTVLKEIVLPEWMNWELLFEWSQTQKVNEGRQCILCNNYNEHGMEFKEKFICEQCFLKIKNME
ncbi:MAG: hypothetical protein JW703_00285, partial [Candidatus Diapherotrites archaeon]|nr:hypothetical protein [Candidatus Diapherotrites archaeon]